MAKNYRNNKKNSFNKEDSKGKYSNKKRTNKRGTNGEVSDVGSNDISWYSKYPNLLAAASNIPFPYKPGMDINLGKVRVDGTEIGNRTLKLPGVMSLDWIPTIGYAGANTEAPSVVAKEIYARVRAKYSGGLDADPADFLIYIVCLDSIFSYIAYLKRIYRTLNAWTPLNYNLPDRILHMMKINNTSIAHLRESKIQFWQMINELVLQSRKFTCPAIMDLFNRHYWMNDNVYTDSNTVESPMFLFNPKGFYKFSMLPMPDGNPGPGAKLTLLPAEDPQHKAELISVFDYYNYGLNLIAALNEWDDSYTISGYLARAFEGTPTFMVEELPQNEILAPIFNPEVLIQIKNSKTIPAGTAAFTNGDIENFNITQDAAKNTVISKMEYTVDEGLEAIYSETAADAWRIPALVDLPKGAANGAMVVEATRLTASVVRDATDEKKFIVLSCGTEVPITWRMSTEEYSESSDSKKLPIALAFPQHPVLELYSDSTVSDLNQKINLFNRLYKVTRYTHHPLVYLTTLGGTEASPDLENFDVIGNLHDVAPVYDQELRNLHKVCIMSELSAFSIQ